MCDVYPSSCAVFRIREKFWNISQKGPPSDLAIFFFLPSSMVLGFWPGFGFILSTRNLHRIYLYDDLCVCIWWNHIFVLLTIESGNYILDFQGQNNYFLNNFIKDYFFQNFNAVSYSTERDISIKTIQI